ncbi:L,D-transpeptidase [Aureimonas altamirensis]|uniref:L,D-transpeptidase n=1 Tax=Aureimonas altamirensis TaxID=370622 RepID=UPI00203723A3|nr:L,D-transpeptidase [Aureimonas altamirensis]MCM2505692.1 L,D-transpeptidase [Aureimonas altamirensis]
MLHILEGSCSTRRKFLALAGASAGSVLLSGCVQTTLEPSDASAQPELSPLDPYYVSMYAAMPQERFPIPAVDLRRVDKRFYRRLVDDPTGERPGTVVVDTQSYYLYLVQPEGQALRYGVGLGRQGFTWSGAGVVQFKREWPRWTPPSEMIARQPELERFSAENGGQAPGLDNPLGARALYIFQDGRDTLYRLHGTPEFWTIGKAVSSGCVRLINQDIVDLYGRVSTPTPIVVRDGLNGAV